MKFLSVSVLLFALACLVSAHDDNVLNPAVIQNINPKPVEPTQAESLVSNNNFINFCLGKKITNGLQITEGSCNPTPMGIMPSTQRMVSSKFLFPINLQNIKPFQDFQVKLQVKNMKLGSFTNPKATFFAAPQVLDGEGRIIGHSHIVIERIESFTSTKVLDPLKFAFFKGLNAPDVNGVLTEVVTGGLPNGVYKLSSINSSSNHQPVLLPVAQHGSADDAIYFTVGAGFGNNDDVETNNSNNNSNKNSNKNNKKNKKRSRNNRRHVIDLLEAEEMI